MVCGNTVYLAGLISEDWNGDISQQAREVFTQIDFLLAKAGSDKKRILSMTCWIKDFNDYASFNEAYDDWIDCDSLPARATVRADMLDEKIRIEIMCVATL